MCMREKVIFVLDSIGGGGRGGGGGGSCSRCHR